MGWGLIVGTYRAYKAWKAAKKAADAARKAKEAAKAAEKTKKTRESFSDQAKGGVEKCKPPKKAWSPGPRPKGVPKDWIPKASDKDGGTKWVDPKNPHNSVRSMPGDPNSPYPNSQKPYVRWTRNGRPLDRSGRELPTKYSNEAHIPQSEFEYIP